MALSAGERRLLTLFVASVCGDWPAVEAVRRSAADGEPDRAWREVILMVHVFAGFPRQVETFEVLERAGGSGTPDADEVLAQPAERGAGQALFERIYQRQAASVQARLTSFHPDFADWILGHAYGRVLSRPGLSADRRELFAIAALAVSGQDRQLASHTRGALFCGATQAEIRATLEVIEPWMSAERRTRARAVVERFFERTSLDASVDDDLD